MSNSPVVAVAMFQSYQEASMAQASLAAEGIESQLTGGVTADTMAYFGTATGGVRLLVHEKDASRAGEVLDSLAQGRESPAAPSWRCPDCGEQVEGHFDLCWSCGRLRPEDEAQTGEMQCEIDSTGAARAEASVWPETTERTESVTEDDERAAAPPPLRNRQKQSLIAPGKPPSWESCSRR
jgi:hypothetical protein